MPKLWSSLRSIRLVFPATLRLAVAAMLLGPALLARADEHDKDKKEVVVKTPWGGFDARVKSDAAGIGLPLYPGARLIKSQEDQPLDAELKISGKPTVKFIVGKFRTAASRDKVLAFYQKQLGKKVTKFTEKSEDGSTVFEIKRKLDQQYVSLKTNEGMTEIDLVRIEGLEGDAEDSK